MTSFTDSSLRLWTTAPLLEFFEEITDRIVIELSVSGILVQPIFQMLF